MAGTWLLIVAATKPGTCSRTTSWARSLTYSSNNSISSTQTTERDHNIKLALANLHSCRCLSRFCALRITGSLRLCHMQAARY
jgi:hypothetical protein